MKMGPSRQVARRFAVAAVLAAVASPAAAQDASSSRLADAQHLFYNAQYQASAAMAAAAAPLGADEALALAEVRTSALLFQIRGLLASPNQKMKASESLKRCTACPALIDAFMTATKEGQTLARERLAASPADETALFFLGKLDLNYVWLHLGPLGRKTGWDEYWEARKSLDAVLKARPNHVRARVARAWMEYIVDTRLPWGTEWLLGGGDKKRALTLVREAAAHDAAFFEHAEAEFALWEMLIRERRTPQALEVAGRLAVKFPNNPEVARFLEKGTTAQSDR